MKHIRTYYLLTKPGIILGNLITTAGGFGLFLTTMLGLGAVIGSACVFNNYIDRKGDQKMTRTKNRPLAKGLITGKKALLFALLLGLFGILFLFYYTNAIATLMAALGFFIYVVLYSFWKYHTSYATLVGSISGAIPPVVGYTAVSHSLDWCAFLLFLILVLWQMPHFYAIALYRLKEYSLALIPVLPIQKGAKRTKVHMLLYIIAFTLTAPTLTFLGYTGSLYAIMTFVLGVAWLGLCLKGFKAQNDALWARQMFIFSLVVITLLCVLLVF
jgi:protoheme IX farnesyltransferase